MSVWYALFVMKEESKTVPDEHTIYELGYHLVPTVGDEKLGDAVAEIRNMVLKSEGVFIMEERPVLMTLAYTMVKVITGRRERHNSAYFGWVKFAMESRHVASLKEALDQNDSILRYLLVTTVREDTRAPKRVLSREDSGKTISKPTRVSEKAAPISEEELDRSIAGLVA